MHEMWSELKAVDPSLEHDGVYRQNMLEEPASTYKHCCHSHQYARSVGNPHVQSACQFILIDLHRSIIFLMQLLVRMGIIHLSRMYSALTQQKID